VHQRAEEVSICGLLVVVVGGGDAAHQEADAEDDYGAQQAVVHEGELENQPHLFFFRQLNGSHVLTKCPEVNEKYCLLELIKFEHY